MKTSSMLLPAGEGDDFTPVTAEQFKGFYNGTDVPLTDENVSGILKTAEENKIGEPVLKEFAAFHTAALPKPVEPPPHVPITLDMVKGALPSETKVDDGSLTKFVEFANANKFSEETVKSFISFDQDQLKANNEASTKLWNEQQAKWKGELEKDSLLTADGGYEENLKKLNNLIKDYGGEVNKETQKNELQEALELGGLLQHPAVGRFLMRVHKALPKEPNPAPGSQGGPGKASVADTLFDKT